MTDKIVVRNLFKIYGDDPAAALDLLTEGHDKDSVYERTGQTVGVQDASFSVSEGEIFVVMGLSGCGKSTLVRMINRLIEPTLGSVLIDGRDVIGLGRRELIELRRREVSMVFQSFALMPHLNARLNAAFGLDIAGVDAHERLERADRALDTVGLLNVADAYPDELSGGMQQRVGLARALALDPAIMLMDEAFSALDPLIRTEMQDELLRLQHAHARTVVFISHDLDEAFRIGDRIAIMDSGRIVQVGTPEEIVHAPANDYVRSFFRGVDVSKVLKTVDIACEAEIVLTGEPGTDLHSLLKELRARGGEFGYVVDGAGAFLGVVSPRSLDAALEKASPSLREAFLPAIEPLAADTPVERLMGRVASSPCPAPVIDGARRLVGVVSKSGLLETLDKAM